MTEKIRISTSRLTIRNLELKDLDDFFEYRSNPEVTEYQGFDVMTLSETERFIISQCKKEFGILGEWVQYGIEERMSGRLVGDCAIRLLEEESESAEIGITISHLHQRKGFAKEVMNGILKFLFDKKNIHRVVELTDVKNTASVNLLKSCGFRKEGHFVESRIFKGNRCSEYQYAMLKREWDDMKNDIKE